MALAYAKRAREDFAAFLDAQFSTALAAVETAQSLAANSLGRVQNMRGDGLCIRGFDPVDPSDNKVEVYILRTTQPSQKDRTIYHYDAEVAITLLAADGLILPLQARLLDWETAWWNLTSKGATTAGGSFLGALCSEMSQDTMRGPKGGHLALSVARVLLIRQEP